MEQLCGVCRAAIPAGGWQRHITKKGTPCHERYIMEMINKANSAQFPAQDTNNNFDNTGQSESGESEESDGQFDEAELSRQLDSFGIHEQGNTSYGTINHQSLDINRSEVFAMDISLTLPLADDITR